MLSDWWQKNIARLTDPSCSLCGMNIEHEQLLSSHHAFWCTHCRSTIIEHNRCQCCGLPTESPQHAHCGECLKSPPLWNRLYCLSDYQPPLSHLVSQLKYQRQFWHARPLAIELAEIIDNPAPTITCVPMHWTRRIWRGFNHSEHLAYFISHKVGSHFNPKLLHRTKMTRPQRGLSSKQRKTNLNHAFEVSDRPLGKHVAIVDDVVTTGATIEQLCKLLLDVGVETIDIYCVCRTTLSNNTSL
ncbi:ComF family protein [Vibrio agarivorans]|uniref:ComF family protein n=1 Tax=Vibrio agarivorans TaxID=153622 RepID=UPI0022306DDC|nr:phosphoribosyltransferase family protein [Vibrio agarivorans]